SFLKAIATLIEFQKNESEKWSSKAQATANRASWISGVLMLVGALFAMTLGWVLASNLTSGIARIIDDLNAAATQTLSASGQVSSSSQSLAQGATEQAAGVQETSASLEEIAGMTRQNAEHASNVETLAQRTQETTKRGGEAMNRMEAAIQ